MVQAVGPSETRHHYTNAPCPPGQGGNAARYEALLCTSYAISAQRDPKAVFRVLVSELRHVVTFDAIGVVLYDDATRQRTSMAWRSSTSRTLCRPPDFAPEEMVTWWAYLHQQPIVI